MVGVTEYNPANAVVPVAFTNFIRSELIFELIFINYYMENLNNIIFSV